MATYNIETVISDYNDVFKKQENGDDYGNFLINRGGEDGITVFVKFYNPPNGEDFKYGFLVGETYEPTDLLYFDGTRSQRVPKPAKIIYGKGDGKREGELTFTIKGGKRKTRRNRKSKKSIKGKSRKNRRKSNRRRSSVFKH